MSDAMVESKVNNPPATLRVAASWNASLEATPVKNRYLIKAAKVGSKMFVANGACYIWTKKGLEVTTPSWVGGKVTVNHDKNDYGKIVSAAFDGEFTLMEIEVNDELAAMMGRNMYDGAIGVSIEADLFDYDDSAMVVNGAFGTGVAIIIWPIKPACPLDAGCGVITMVTGSDSTPKDEMRTNNKPNGETMAETENETKLKLEAEASQKRATELEAENAKLKEANAKLVEDKRAELLAVIAKDVQKIDPYKDMTLCNLKVVAMVIDDVKAKLSAEPIVTSGATTSVIASAPQAPVADPLDAKRKEAYAEINKMTGLNLQ